MLIKLPKGDDDGWHVIEIFDPSACRRLNITFLDPNPKRWSETTKPIRAHSCRGNNCAYSNSHVVHHHVT